MLPVSALAGGILIAHFYFFELTDLYVPIGLALAALALALASVAGRRLRLPVICALMILAGMATQIIHRETKTPVMNAEDTETVLLSGCVTNPPVFSPTREQFTLELAPKAAARISVNLKSSAQSPLNYGQKVEVAAKIRKPRNYENPDGFDYAAYLANQHIYWTGSVSSPADIRVVPGQCGSTPITWLFNVRTWALGRLVSLYPNDPETSALLQATLLGETSSVDRRWTSDFRLTGTYHALVISGQHISVLAFTLLVLLKLVRVRRVPALCIATIACWLYAFISGLSAPVVRAAGGFTLFLAAAYFFRKTRILNILGAVGLVYLAFAPDQLFDPSFQLSFLSAAAIAVFAIPAMERLTEPLREAVKRFEQVRYDPNVEGRAASLRVELRLITQTICAWTKLSETTAQHVVRSAVLAWAFVAEAVIVSACVQFGLALPMIVYFHRLSITGLSANIVVVPLLSVVVPLGFAAIATGWHFLAWLTALFLKCAEFIATWHVRFEPSWRTAAIPLALGVCFAVSLVLLAWAIRCNRRCLIPALVYSLALFAAIYWQPWRPELHPRMLEVTAIDVSQGDSVLLVFPDGETMLVDAGGFPGMSRMARKPNLDVGEDVVSPYLWSRRIRHLDYAVLTHGHSDHMAGLPAILDNFHPRALWVGAEPQTDEWKVVEQHAKADHVPIVSLTRNSPPVTIGGAQIKVLAPSPDYVPGKSATNDDSLVFQVNYGRRSVLMTGDAERPIEDDLVQTGLLHPVTLLKVGHHGSKTSSSEEFLREINPQFAFISDGYKNQFHHPSPGVLERFAQHHTAVFRTDQHGLLTFLTDGNKVELNWFH